ncbi:alpha/beta hydrolase [Methylibium rhizosphaerae]|uniref:alpha/beta hydrolase n=1 Tax=Methylibium rhizosphaerae TaxID=2570323 RepID=UPI001129C01A|nr:alpha/beta hydrolase [Methylibium rhizosphaerae]
MTPSNRDTVPALLVKNLAREVVLGVEEALTVGAQRAYTAARGMDEGHLPHVVGQLRHFHMNEAFQRALATANSSPSALRGNSIVTGRAGIFTIARFNIPEGFWINGRRSQTRRQMSFANKAIEPLVQPELFEQYQPPSEGVAFFVACFSGSLQTQPDSPVSIQIAVPDREMRGWLFREPLGEFVKRYDHQDRSATQDDLAVPKLKKHVVKRQDKDGTSE